jgi:hypothetical protein
MDAGTMMLIGTGIQAGARVGGGVNAERAGRYNAAGLERQAAGEVAAAQRAAFERRTDTERVISKQVATAAASGAGGGPSLLDVIGDTAARGEYQAQSEMFAGSERARTLKDRAAITRQEGRNALVGSILEGVGTVATGTARYGLNFGSSAPSTGGYDPSWRRTSVAYG